MTITIPAQINAAGLLPFLSCLNPDASDFVTLDFSNLRRVTPAALVSLVATVNRWISLGLHVEFAGLDKCAITGYLQRMNTIAACGVRLAETFSRHDERGRFVPVQHLGANVSEMGTAIASCVAPGGEDYGHPMADVYDLVWYVLTETATNVNQHSCGKGFVSAQVGRVEGLVRLAVADNGTGIRQSFINCGFSWASSVSDAQAILKALEARVSSKGSPVNEGVGLTLVSLLARLTRAWLLIVSGTGVLTLQPGKEPVISALPENGRYQGTIVALTFVRGCVRDYANLLLRAKQQAGLLHNLSIDSNFVS